MSSNNEFPIPFEDSRRGLAANQEEKAAVGRLGKYLASRGVDRPTIGEGRKRRRLGNIELPTGGKPGKRKPTGSRMDVDGDGWADEGTTKPVWVGIDGQGKKPKQRTESPKPSSSSSKRKLSSGFYNLVAIETDESTPEKLESLKEQLGDALVSHETSTVDIGARGKSNVRKKHTFRIDNSGLRNTYAHNYATNRGFVAQIEAAPSETRLSSGMTQLSEIEVYDYGNLKAAKKVRSTQPKGKEEDYWIVLDKDGEVRAYSASAVDEKRKKLLDNFNQQGKNPFNGKKSPLSIDDVDMQDVLRSALGDEKMKIIAALETWYVEDRNEVFQINTRGGHRRRGIAAEMFNTHREVFPERDLQHSDALSEDGKAFSAATPATSVSGRFSSGRDINAKLNLERYGDNEESAYVSSFEIGSKKFSVSRGGDSPGRNMYNGYLVAFDENGKNVGYIDYNSDSVDKTATVAMTEVTEEYKRMGIASALLDSLLIDFPDYEISPGYTTDEGAAWWRRVTGSDGPIKAERNTRLSSGATRRVGARNVYDRSVDYNDKRNPSELLETSRDGKEYSSIRFNGDGYDIKTSQSEDGFSVFIEDESGQIASLTFSEPPTGETASLLSYKASKESQKAGVLEALLDHVLVKNPDTNITSTAETRRWLQYVNNGTADYGVKGFRKYGFSGKYIDGEDVLRDGDYTLESDLLLKTSNVSSSPVKVETFSSFSKNEYIWEGQVYKIGNESIVFGAHEQAEFGDGIKKLPLNPFEILNLDPSSAEGRKAAKKWYSAVHGADVSVLAESSDFNASSYVSALLYAASKGDKDAQKEFDEFAKYSDSLLEKIDSKLPPIENPEKALSLDSRLVHQTSYKPTIDENGYLVLRPLEDFPQTAKDGTEVTVNRTTLHFAINHLAEGHMFRKETDGESYVVVASLDSFVEENPDSLENFNIVDTAASPPPGDGLRFPPGSYKLVEIKNGEDGRKKVEDILRADGVEVLVGGERHSGTPGADEAGRIRAQMLGVSPSVASDLTLANLEQVNRTNISDQRQYADVPSSTSFFQEASKNALLRIANRKENAWVSTSRKLNDKDPLNDSKFRLASGKAPRYPREPTLGAFLEGAEERFDGVNSWEEFRERYNDTEMVFLDYETTGLDFDEFGKATTNGNPTQIGLVRMKNGKEIGRLNLFMNPEEPLGEWSLANLKDADGNPITNEWLATQMPMAEAHRQVAEFIGPDAIIGVQNATFDKRVLEDALEREGIDWRPSGYLDTRDISAMTLPVWSEESPEGPYVTDRDGNKKPSSSLAAITQYLDVELGDGHHNADADAFATSQVMQKIIDRAIENGWSTDVLDREKRDSKLKADNDKFNADVEKFESDKEAFVANQEEGSAKLSSGRNQVVTVGPVKKGITPKKIQVRSEDLISSDEYGSENMTQYEAFDAISELNDKARPGEPQWRLPTSAELIAIFKKNKNNRRTGDYLTEEYDASDEDGAWVKTVNMYLGTVGRERIYNTARVLLVSDSLPKKDDSKFDGPPTTRKLNAFIKNSGISVSRMTQDNEGSVSFNIPLKGKNSDDDAYEFVRKLESWARDRQLVVDRENDYPEDFDWRTRLDTEEDVRQARTGINVRVYDRLASGANVVEAFNEPTEVTQQEAAEAGSNRETLTGKKVAERIIQKIEETTGTTLTDQQKRIIEREVPGLTREIAGKTLLDVEIDDAFSETGKQLLESISIDISSDGIPFVSADPIPQLAEQIPDKRDWRTIELPKRDDVVSILDEAMKDTVVFKDGVWKDTDGNIVARQTYKNETDGSVLEYENDEAKARFPMLEMIAPKGFVVRSDDIGLRALAQDRLPAPYLEAWKKYGQFLRELSRRAGELMGDEELFVPGSRINTSTSTYLRGYIGGITDPSKFNMGLDGKALQASHDLFGHLGTGRAFDRHGEWANDLAMMSIVDHPDSPLTPQEKRAVRHLTFMMYSAQRMLHTGRLDEQEQNQRESESFRNRPRSVFDITDMTTLNEGSAVVRVYAGDFDSVIKKFDAVSTSKRLSSGRKSIYEADAKDVELALAHDALGKNDRLSSGRQREMIPMNVPSKKREGAGATGYGTQGSLGKIVRRDSSTWLSGLDSDEISRVIIPTNAEEYFEMWADDIAGPAWRTDKNRETFIKNYYAELQKDPTNIPVDYSPESIAATQKLVKDLLDSSPSVMWVMQNFGAPLIVPFTREGMDAYENSPDMKERLALLAKQRGTEKIPFVSGLANRSLGSIGISPRALIDRESLLNDDKGVYPISLDPDRVPAPRDAHIDRSLEGTIVHEFGHWLHHRALWDTETNGASGKMRSYYGTGKLSDPRYVASLDVAEEYADYDTDDKRIEIYSQFIDLTGRSPEEMFRAHPDEPLLSTSYGNINKREAMAEAFVAIMHPNKEMPEKTLSKKLRKDIYTLIGVDEKDLPWSDSETVSETRLSSGSQKGKRKNIFSRFKKEETEEEIGEEKRKPQAVERPEGLVSFAPEPSEELLKASPVPDEQTLKDEVLRDVQSLALEFDEGALGSPISGLLTKASVVAKKTIASNLSRSVDFDVEDFINLFATDEKGFGFHSTETFAAVQKMYKTLKNLPINATSEQRKTAARGAFDSKNGRIISAKIHDDILGRARYYDEILDELETKEFGELFSSPSFAELIATDGGEKSLFTPYLMTKLGTDDIKREFLEEIVPRREVLNNLISEIKENESKAFGLARIGEPNPKTGEQDYELISLLGRGVDKNIIEAISSLDIGDEDYGQKFADIMSAFNGLLTGQKLIKIREAGFTKIDSSNIDSPEIQKALKQHLVANVRSRSGNYESKTENYTKKTGVVFFDLETTEGKQLVREALVSDLIHTWAISANNANPVALAIQHEARKMFGLDEAMGWSTSPLKALRPEEKEGMLSHQFDAAPELTDAQTAMIRPILQKIYDSTQLYYKTKGITHIPVYRGFTQSDTRLLPGEIGLMDTTMRPLSSWATSIDIARSFSGQSTASILKHTPTLIKSFVPVEDIFSNALSGFGCLHEDEVVLLGKPMKVLAMRTDTLKPLSMDNPLQQELLEKLKDINIENINEEFKSIERRKNVILENAEKIEELFSSGSDMQNIELINTDLVGKKLSGANLSGANMNYADMREIDLSNADLTGADLSRADLTGANLDGANIPDAQLVQAEAKGVKMNGANLSGADLTDANFENAKLDDARLIGARLKGTNLRNAYLFDADLKDANLYGADLSESMLHGANLTGADLQGASLSGATLTEADLTSANLEGVSLLGANLTGANLTGANLRGANLNGVKLDGVNLRGADLTDTVYADYRPSSFLSSGKKSHTPKWKTVEEVVDFEVLGASPDDSEEDRDDIVKESVGGDWMQWDPCREIRTAAYELAGIDEYSERDPNISQSGGFFGNSKFQTTVSPEKRTEQARYLMASVIDSLINGRKYDRQPYLYRAMMFSSPEEGKQFFDAMQVGSQVDIPLLAFVEIGPSPRGDHFLTRFGSDALLVLEDFPGSYQTGGTFEPVFSNRHESDTLYNINEFAEAILADIENGEVDEENAEYDKEFADKLIKLVEDYREAKTPLEKSNIKIDIEEALDEVGNETIQREWEGEPLPEDHEEYYDAMDDEDAGMTPREFVSGGRLEVVSVKPDESKAYRQIITLRQVGAFDPQEKGALVLKTDGENSTRFSSGKKPVKKAKPKSVQLHDDEFEKKFNQEVPDGDGDCFSEAVQQARKLAEAYDKVKIVHGYPLGTGGEAKGLRFPHAWAEFERDGEVWVRDYSNGNRIEFPQILYYGIGNIEENDVSRYDIKEAEANMIENEHYGPW